MTHPISDAGTMSYTETPSTVNYRQMTVNRSGVIPSPAYICTRDGDGAKVTPHDQPTGKPRVYATLKSGAVGLAAALKRTERAGRLAVVTVATTQMNLLDTPTPSPVGHCQYPCADYAFA